MKRAGIRRMKGAVERDDVGKSAYNLVANSILLSRQSLINGRLLDPKGRDLNAECGYPIGEPTAEFYWELYSSVSFANRVVGAYPTECWSVYPDLYEVEDEKITEFEEAWAKLNQDGIIWNFLNRVDELSGIGSFGILFFGFGDNKKPDQPVAGINEDGTRDGKKQVENELLFIRVFDQSRVDIVRYETNLNNRRYGQPVEYVIRMDSPNSLSRDNDRTTVTASMRVHWTRVLHVADNRKSSEVFGMPRMRPVIPEIMDIRKIRGGSAEMFWRGAFPGYSFESFPELGIEVGMDKETVQEEFESYSNGLQRYLALTGVTAKSLAPQISAPTDHLEEQYRSAAAQLGMPLRILLGSESGHLASSQDTATWNRRLAKRQQIYISPSLIRPFVLLMMMTGVLPWVDDFKIAWNDLNTLSATDKADITLKQTQALMTYVTGGVEQVMSLTQYLTNIMGMTGEGAQAIIKEQKKIRRKQAGMFTAQGAGILIPTGSSDPAAAQATQPAPQGGGRNGGDKQNSPGNPGTDGAGKTNRPARGKGTPNSAGRSRTN